MTLTPNFYVGEGTTGEKFSNYVEGVTLIRNSLQASNWVIMSDDITGSGELKMQGQDPAQVSDKCYFLFRKDSDSNIEMRGYLGDDANEESPNITYKIGQNNDNRLWLTCDSGRGVLTILDGSRSISDLYSSLGTYRGNSVEYAHFGFTERVLLGDKYSWYIGRPNYQYDDVWAAKSFHNNTVWRQLSDDYYEITDWNNRNQVHPVQGVFDRLTIAKPRQQFDYSNNRNAAYEAYRGAFNGVDNKPYYDIYFYQEGRRSSSGYGGPIRNRPMYFRGAIPFVATGAASQIALETFNDQYGNKWMSCNNYGAQAMLVETI